MHKCLVLVSAFAFGLALASQPPVQVFADDKSPSPPAVSERALKIHHSGLLFDGHNDLPWRLRSAGDMSFKTIDIAQRSTKGQTDIPRMREGGLKAQFWSVYIPSEHPDPARTVLEQIDLVHRMVKRLSKRSRAGKVGRRRRADRQGGQDRLSDRHRRRRRDRERSGDAAYLSRSGRGLHDAHPQ